MSRDYDAKRLARQVGIPYAEALRRVRAERAVNTDLVDLGGTPLADLPDAAGLDDQLQRVRDRLEKGGPSISGYNGAGGDLEEKSTVDVELPHD